MTKEIKEINPGKSSSKNIIPLKVLKISSEASANVLQNLLDKS